MTDYPNSPGYKEHTTSRDAAEALVASGRYSTLFDAVLNWYMSGNVGTPDDCAVALGEQALSIRPRVSQLKAAGAIAETGQRRKSVFGGRSSHVLKWVDE